VDNFLAWQPEKTGLFTVCSAYGLALRLQKVESVLGSSSHPDVEEQTMEKYLEWQRSSQGENFCLETSSGCTTY
jgi:hypothetical protein